MGATGIKHLDMAWNVVTGCTPVGEGCRTCWARELHNQRHKAYLAGKKMPEQYVGAFSHAVCHEDRLSEPLRWRTGKRVGVAYTGDLFHDDVPDTFLDCVFAVMDLSPWHTFFVPTKRVDRLRRHMVDLTFDRLREPMNCFVVDGQNLATITHATRKMAFRDDMNAYFRRTEHPPLSNVWLGASVWDQTSFDASIPHIQVLSGDGWNTWLSIEPLLGPIICHKRIGDQHPGVGMVLIGGESCSPRAKARPCNVEWIRSLVEQCVGAGVPVHVKQLGSYMALKNRSGSDPAEWPEDLRKYAAWPAIAGLYANRIREIARIREDARQIRIKRESAEHV